MSKKSSHGIDSIWDVCRSNRQAEAERKNWVAERVNLVARELGAGPGVRDGEWELKCPHCGRITYISESKGCAFAASPDTLNCPAMKAIAQRVRDRL
jgi:hypothetical protein